MTRDERNQPHVNKATLTEFRAQLRPDQKDVVFELVELFLRGADDSIKKVKEGLATQNRQTLSNAGHKLKSSARHVGANHLADLCYALEMLGKNIEPDFMPTAQSLYQQIKDEFAAVKLELEEDYPPVTDTP
jgi:HPt (histidine-containing phosphotransfer) domain-containing protein